MLNWQYWAVKGLDTISSLLEVTETNYCNRGETGPHVENSTCHLRKTKQGYYPPNFKGKSKFGSTNIFIYMFRPYTVIIRLTTRTERVRDLSTTHECCIKIHNTVTQPRE